MKLNNSVTEYEEGKEPEIYIGGSRVLCVAAVVLRIFRISPEAGKEGRILTGVGKRLFSHIIICSKHCTDLAKIHHGKSSLVLCAVHLTAFHIGIADHSSICGLSARAWTHPV